MKHLLNEPSAMVTESLDAAVQFGEGKVARLEGAPALKALVRTDLHPARVAVISGGGSGHEPAHAGFVGAGLLSAAVCGDVFASPSVDAVLTTIRAVTGPAGCLLIVKNYTGDRLNFGLAAERARAEGLAVEMVVVADDVSLDGVAQPRGIAGTLFVHKIAGFYAEAGRPLSEVLAHATAAAKAVRTLGVALSSVHIPGRPRDGERIGPDEVEVGLGIHGEPGAARMRYEGANSIVAHVVTRLFAHLPPESPCAILLNDLGGATHAEMSVVGGAVLKALGSRARWFVGPARLMTALDMHGFSLSALPLEPAFEAALVAPVGPRAWPGVFAPATVSPVAQVLGERPRAAPSAEPRRRALLAAACEALIVAQSELDRVDARVGDGDTGSTFAAGARALLARLDTLPFANLADLCQASSEVLAESMGGSSGVLLAIAATAAARALQSGETWIEAFAAATERIAAVGGATRGDRTMLDALLPAVDALRAGEGLVSAAAAANAGARATATLTRANGGRASYVPASALLGNPDPGALAVAIALTAASNALESIA